MPLDDLELLIFPSARIKVVFHHVLSSCGLGSNSEFLTYKGHTLLAELYIPSLVFFGRLSFVSWTQRQEDQSKAYCCVDSTQIHSRLTGR